MYICNCKDISIQMAFSPLNEYRNGTKYLGQKQKGMGHDQSILEITWGFQFQIVTCLQ